MRPSVYNFASDSKLRQPNYENQNKRKPSFFFTSAEASQRTSSLGGNTVRRGIAESLHTMREVREMCSHPVQVEETRNSFGIIHPGRKKRSQGSVPVYVIYIF